MNKKVLVIFVCIIMLTSNLTFSQEIGSDLVESNVSDNVVFPIEEVTFPITLEELGTPNNLKAELKGDYFLLSWTNNVIPNINAPYDKVEVQVDYRPGKASWLSQDPAILDYGLPTYEFVLNSKSIVNFDPKSYNIPFETINLDNNSYNIRLRYVYIYYDSIKEKRIYGNFSSSVSLGLQPYYKGASPWAESELERAYYDYGISIPSIRQNVNNNINREEFSEVVVKLYEKATNKPISYTKNPFTDTENQDVLKAASLGIVYGIGDGLFAPKELLTREAMAVILSRTLELIYPKENFKDVGSKFFPDNDKISIWAMKGLQILTKFEILKGDELGNLNPLSNTTREQAVAIVVRSYELFK